MKKRLLPILLSIAMVMSSVSVYADDLGEVVESVEESEEASEESVDEGSDYEEADESGDEQVYEIEELVLTVTEVPTEPETVTEPEMVAEPETVVVPETVTAPETVTEPEEVSEAAIAEAVTNAIENTTENAIEEATETTTEEAKETLEEQEETKAAEETVKPEAIAETEETVKSEAAVEPETVTEPETSGESDADLKSAAEKSAAEKVAAEKSAAEKVAAEKSAAEKAAAEKVAAEKAATEKAAAEKAAAEKTAAEKTAAEKTDSQGSKTVALDKEDASLYNKVALDFIDGIRDTYTKEVKDISTSLSANGRYNLNFTLKETNDRTGEIKTYIYTLSGFSSEAYAQDYIDSMCNKTEASAGLELVYIGDPKLVDAEKRPWSYWDDLEKDPSTTIYPPYDSNLCWAGSVSDMLELSGWNKAERINNHGINVSDEDYIFDLFADNYTDYAGNQIYGVKWFFNGINETEKWDDWAHLKNEEGYSEAFLRDYCVDDFVVSVPYPTEEKLVDVLKTIDQDEDGDRCTIGLVFGYYVSIGENEIKRNGGHCVTIVGYSTDENGMPNSITIADSDSYNRTGTSYSKDNNRRDYENMYITYPIEFYDGSWHIMNFASEMYDTKIDDLIVLKYYSDNTKNMLEQGGTKDLVNFVDFMPYYERTFQNDIDEMVNTIYQGDLLNAGFALKDNSICKREYVEKLTYRFIISRNGEVIRVIDDVSNMEDTQGNGTGYFYYSTILDDSISLEPGEYSVSFIVNYDKSTSEAYYNNNQSRHGVKFVVLKRIDENGETEYVVVPEKAIEENRQEESQESVIDFIQNILDYSVVTDMLEYENNPAKVLVFHMPEIMSGTEITEADLAAAEIVFDYSVTGNLEGTNGTFGGQITSKIAITKDDFQIVRNADGSISIVFSNEFMKKLPKGTHYFRMLIAGKSQIFKIEVK